MITAIICLIIFLYIFSTIALARDLKAHWPELLNEPGRLAIQAPTSFLLNFFSGFGVSDYVICTALYLKTGWSTPKKLPGTLNTQSAMPALIFSIAYLSSVKVDIITLLPLLAAEMLGAYLSPRFAMRLPVRRIKQILACGLLFAGCTILSTKLGLLNMGGTAMGLSGLPLVIGALCYFIIGVLKGMGVASYPLSMTATYFLGLHPLVSYPLMMGGGALSAPVLVTRYIKLDGYMRKMTLLGATVGVVAGFLAVFVVKTLDVSLLQWLVVGVVLYASTDMLLSLHREKAAERSAASL